MNAAKRLAGLLLEIQKSKKSSAYDIFSEIFGVEGCPEVANKVYICLKELEKIEKHVFKHKVPNAQRTINELKNEIFQCRCLSNNINKSKIPQVLGAIEMLIPFMPDDEKEYDNKALTELADQIIRLHNEIETNEDLESTHKEILLSFASELLDGVTVGQKCGFWYLQKKTEIAAGKFVLYNDVFKNSGYYDIATDILNKTTGFLDKVLIFYGATEVLLHGMKLLSNG